MQYKRWFQEVIRQGVVAGVDTLTGDGTEAPISRIGVPYEVGENKKTGETYIRMYVTHLKGETGEVEELPEEERKYRTIPLHKIMEDSQQRYPKLTYYPAPVK